MSNNDEKVGIILSWDTVVTKFENLIKFAAKQQIQNNGSDGVVGAEDLYQEGMIKLYDCWKKWCVNPEHNKGMDEFGAIFKKSLFRVVKKGTSRHPECIDLDDAIMDNMIPGEESEDVVERMYREHGIQHLMEILNSDVARNLLSELIEPSPRTLYEVWSDLKRKEMIRSQGKKVNIPKDNTVRMKHIIRALGITTKQYDIAMAEIREKARLTLCPM